MPLFGNKACYAVLGGTKSKLVPTKPKDTYKKETSLKGCLYKYLVFRCPIRSGMTYSSLPA